MTGYQKIILKKDGITDFAQERNRLMRQARSGWLLFVDADEVVSPALDQEIRQLINQTTPRVVFALRRTDWFLGRKLKFGETSGVRLVRLMPKNSGFWQGRVHERFVSKFPIKTLQQPLLHKRRMNLSQFLDRLNYYSSLRASEITKFSLFELLFYPWVKFVKNYFCQLGFLDGLPGLAMAFFMSLHSLAVRIKVYENH